MISEEDATLDELSAKYIEISGDRNAARNVEMLKAYHDEPRDPDKSKEIVMRFLVSPTEIKGDDRVEQMTIVHNELYENHNNTLRPRATDRYETIDAGLVLRSIGYRGVSLPGVPFFEDWGIIPNDHGRVTIEHQGHALPGEYVVGWIKRGPSGIIGTNKPDSQETVEHMLEDAAEDNTHLPSHTAPDAIENFLQERGVRYVTYNDWQIIDALETKRGEELGRPRVKFTDPAEMLRALEETPQPSGD
jgi:ferredoxin--NADP+ reductase